MLLSAVGPCSEVFGALPLDGHVPIRAPGINRWIVAALTELGEKAPRHLELIQSWCSMIVWLTRDDNEPPRVGLTSVALPSLPHCTFVSTKAIRHIPPSVILPVVGMYGLQENLFHEALHQQLSATLVFEPLLEEGWHDAPGVHIPWRATTWPVDRALHAAWVYHHLASFRAEELARSRDGGSAEKAALVGAHQDALQADRYLVAALQEHRAQFGPRRAALLDALAGVEHRVR